MRPSLALAALPLLASAQQPQQPLQEAAQQFQQLQQQQAQQAPPLQDKLFGWFNKAKSSALNLVENFKSTSSSPLSSDPEAPVIISKPAAVPPKPKHVANVNASNWQELFQPVEAGTTDPEKLEWLLLVTGGNKTCFGRCGKLDRAWEEAIPLFSADQTSPSLAVLDCEKQGVVCSTWLASPPYIWHLQIPQIDPANPNVRPNTDIHVMRMNTTTVNPETIYEIHSKRTWEEKEPYESFMHPFDSSLARNGLLQPFGYILFGFSKIPSWLMMVVISMTSRTIMGRRMPQAQQQRAAAGR